MIKKNLLAEGSFRTPQASKRVVNIGVDYYEKAVGTFLCLTAFFWYLIRSHNALRGSE